jgi:hypothetical protein
LDLSNNEGFTNCKRVFARRAKRRARRARCARETFAANQSVNEIARDEAGKRKILLRGFWHAAPRAAASLQKNRNRFDRANVDVSDADHDYGQQRATDALVRPTQNESARSGAQSLEEKIRP